MKRLALFSLCSLALLSACNGGTPSVSEMEQALLRHFQANGEKTDAVKITEVGAAGRGDFDAPGSQDLYWTVRYFYHTAQKVGPLEVGADHSGEAKLWRDKFRHLRVSTD